MKENIQRLIVLKNNFERKAEESSDLSEFKMNDNAYRDIQLELKYKYKIYNKDCTSYFNYLSILFQE
jgi:hypothetical protein